MHRKTFLKEILESHHNKQAFFVESLDDFIKNISLVMPLIDALPNITFFIKDTQAKYQLVNKHLLSRCGLKKAKQVIGKTSEDIFPLELGKSYTEQDLHVIRKQKRISNYLELHSYKTRALGWCMTIKIPIINKDNNTVGVAGISVDLQSDNLVQPELNTKLNKVLNFIENNFTTPITADLLADIGGLSIIQLNKEFKDVFMMTPLQLVQKKRLEYAVSLLSKNISITEISTKCGYTDHSAFTRKFKESTSLTPTQFKKSLQKTSNQ